MALLFSDAERKFLRRPHIARAWFFDLDLPDGRWQLHNGVGKKVVGGIEWRGISDPAGRQIVSISSVEDPRFGQAASVAVAISGVNVAFLRQVKDKGREIEGRQADVYWCAFDQETQEVWPYGLKALFPGYLSAASIQWEGVGSRVVSVTIESLWHTQNFPFGGKWTPAGQRRRFPGDKGFDFVGVKVQEVIKP
ncbi:transcriptional regulator [Pararhizobium gei]|uniref:transcriptional regulator n=1 Tax=Pararhizobium gei TaxID=1395951 RepID=UPI0023DB23AE|nr:transcriptional regulator [Rhizobium gei]